jgi:DNA replication and repair protein RecF
VVCAVREEESHDGTRTIMCRLHERGPPAPFRRFDVGPLLDEQRRSALFEELLALGAQTWLTGTDAGTFGALAGRAQFFEVCDAAVTHQAGLHG